MSDTTAFLISVIAAILPTLLFVGLIYWVDQYEKEPWWLLAAAFLWGAVPSIIVAYIFNTFLSIPVYMLVGETYGDAVSASLVAPLVEETIKGFALLAIFLFWRNQIDSILDGIIYGAMVGMGFAMVENVYYFVNVYAEGDATAWQINIFMRSVIFGLNHALFTSMSGLGIAIARMTIHRWLKFVAPIVGYSLAMFLHFLHNALVSFESALCFLALLFDWGGVILVLGIIGFALYQEQAWIRDYLAEEVRLRILTMEQYRIACSSLRRLRHHLTVLLKQGIRAYFKSVRFYHQCSRLAYKKHHYSLFEDDESQQLIAELRAELSEMNNAPIQILPSE